MKPLNKKLLRDLWHLRGQVIATALVVGCGVASFIAMRGTYDSLLASRDTYYSSYRFADVFAGSKRAPQTAAAALQNVSGVAFVQTRVVGKVTLDLPGLAEPAQGRLVSAPEGPDDLNQLFLLRGRPLEAGRPDEVLISGAFAEANRLNPGDNIKAVMNGRLRQLQVVGIALSPEYIYEIRPGDIFPDNRRFGILWMDRRAVASIFQMEGSFNDVSLTLSPGSNENEVIARVDEVLEPFGGFGSYGRGDQYSHRFISNELAELEVFGTVIPVVFLAVTAFLLNLILSRLVNVEREQIGLLKAFGYSNTAVGVHYLKLAVFAIALGTIVGIAIGAWFGAGMSSLYGDFFHFPVLKYSLSLTTAATAAVISLVSAAIGASSAVLKALRLPPAEAMRPEAPASFHAGVFESSRLHRALNTEGRIVARQLIRHPAKAVLSAVGISLSIALLVIGFYFFDAIDRIIDVQFGHVQREDVEVTFIEPRPGRAVMELRSMPGVVRVEPFRAVSAKLRSAHRSRRVGLIGLTSDRELRRVIGKDLRPVSIPPEGLVLGRTIAESLDVSEGDRVTIEVTEGDRPVKEIVVAKVADELLGLGAYMDMAAIHRLMNEQDAASGAFISVEREFRDTLYDRLKRTPSVAGVGMPEAALESFNETMARTIGTSTSILIGFACVIAFGVVYNNARISLAERGRELASLRVLGFTEGEVGRMLLGEQAALTAAALPLGFMIGIAVSVLITRVVDAEIVRLPIVFSFRTFFLSGMIIVLAAVLSGLLVTLRLKEMDLIEVLKTRE